MLQDILYYMFDEELVVNAKPVENKIVMQQRLIAAGFMPYEIHLALSWIKDLKSWLEKTPVIPLGTRIWTAVEQEKFSKEAISLLLDLEKQKMINAWEREIIIDRALAMNTHFVDEELIKWLTLLVLYHMQAEDKSLEWVEHVLLQEFNNQH